MKSIALIGGGLAAIGAIARIAEHIDESAAGCELRVDQFSAPMRGAEISTYGSTYRLPNSDTRGYMGRWGALLALKTFDAGAFRAFADVFLDCELLARADLNIESDVFSYESDDVPYLCMERGAVNDSASRLIDSTRSSGVLRQINAEVCQLQRSNNGWRVETASSVSDTRYDTVVICAGPIQTPVLLANSGLIDADNAYLVNDHVIQFREVGETSSNNALDPKCREIQIVCSEKTKNGFSHNVQLGGLLTFRPAHMEKLSWRMAGRQRSELFTVGPLGLARTLVAAVLGGVRVSRSSRKYLVTVFDHESCTVALRIKNGKPIVEWNSSMQPGAVSAFHFHGSLNDCVEIAAIEDAGVLVGDLSLSRPLKGINNGCASFQAGYVGLDKAL